MDVDPDDECPVVAFRHPSPPITPFPGFRKGNIVRVQMKNFLTFTNTVIHPGPRMNVILGPNGTGKSTIVSAVCIAFAGNPRLLGRSPDLGAFVKHGETKATVEALIYDPDLPQGVRSVKKTFNCDGKGHFELDGERVRQSDILSKVNRRYDIQLDNISQFMPQEKIAEFVNHRPAELLALAVRSLGGTAKEKEFDELKKLDSTVGNHTQDLKQSESKLAELVAQHEAEAAEVEAYRQQEEAKDKLTLCKKYLPHLEAKELRDEYVKLLAGRRQLEEQAALLRQELQSAESGSINALQQQFDAARDSVLAAKEASKEASSRANDLITDADTISVTLSQKSKDLQDVEARNERWNKRIAATEDLLARAEKEFEDGHHDVKEHEAEQELVRLKEQMEKIRNDMTTENNRKGPLDQKRATAARRIKHYNHKLLELGDVRQERIRSLSRARNGSRHLVDCDRLVHEMKAQGAFRGQVYGPIAAEIETDNTYHAKIMAASVNGFLMGAFVTENASDSRVLITECKRRFSGWSPDTVTAPLTADDQLDEYAIRAQVPSRPVDDRLRSLGIVCVVSDVFRCPDAVRAALNAQQGLHNIHVGTEQCDSFRDELRLEEGIQAWFSPTSRCQVGRSRFDSSVRNLQVETNFANRGGSLFERSVNEVVREKERLAGLIREEEDILRHAGQQMTEIGGRVQELSTSLRQTSSEIRESRERRQIRKRKQDRIDKLTRDVDDYRRQAAERNVARDKTRLDGQILKLQDENVTKIPEAQQSLGDLRSAMAKLDELVTKRVSAERSLNAEKAKHSAAEESIREKARELEVAKRTAKEERARWKQKLAEAERTFPKQEIDKNAEFFSTLADKNADYLRDEIARRSGEIAGLGSGGQQSVERYEHRQRKIDRLTEEVQGQRSQHETKLQELRLRKTEFLSWLQTGMDKMRMKFSSLYRRLGCAGDLELANKDSDRLGDLELQILVSYRDGAELRPISYSANSGGEKMCCTMLFCFSLLLEEERVPPFVFVDELNQGLDPSNEMKIMTMMFEDARHETAPQSFVITPKLLLNLPFHEQTKTHIIFNGSVNGKLDVTAPTTG